MTRLTRFRAPPGRSGVRRYRRNVKAYLRQDEFDFFRIAVYSSGSDTLSTGILNADATEATVTGPKNGRDLEMVDINLGNKTLIVGVLIALILSYGMVNFDSGSSGNTTVPTIEASLDQTASREPGVATANAEPNGVPDQVLEASEAETEAAPMASDLSSLSPEERMEIRRRDRM